MDVVGEGVACDPPELVGKIIRAHPGFFRKLIQGQLFHIMGMDIVGNGIDPFRDRIFRLFRMVDVAVLKMVQPEKKLREDTVQEQFGRICELLGPGMAGKVYDPVQDIDQDRLPVIRETVDLDGSPSG